MNILGIDFEDWYHPELIKKNIKNEKHNPTVINGIDKILDLLRKHETLATFFVVGELLEIKPDIFDKIVENGHEIGFHTMHHDRLDSPGYKEKFHDEIKKFAELTNHKSRGFRAPTFSLNNNSSWAIDVLAENNYMYDSSVVPAKTSLYGLPNAQVSPYKISSKNIVKNNPSIKNSLSEHSINLICDLINPPEHLKHEWLYQIVCNKINHIDVDKIDYILRDSYHIGLPLQGEFSAKE